MRHQCVRCGRIYPSNSPKLLKGCVCGSKLFLYLRGPRFEVKKAQLPKDMERIEQQIRKILGDRMGRDQPISISIENLRMTKEGVYTIDLDSILRGDPIILRDAMGVYFIDLGTVLRRQEAGAV